MHFYRIASVLGLVILVVAAAAETARAQDLHPSRRLSPIGIARTHIGDTYVKVTYGRPYVRGRKIFGADNDSTEYLVPFGKVWRTGASEATEMTVTGPVLVAKHPLEAGTYSVFTVPGKDTWVFHVSPQLGLDGTGIFNADTGEFTPDVFQPANDLFSFSVPSRMLSEDQAVDPFTISFENTGNSGADMLLQWELTQVRVPIRTPK
jgi:hypothetical protein